MCVWGGGVHGHNTVAGYVVFWSMKVTSGPIFLNHNFSHCHFIQSNGLEIMNHKSMVCICSDMSSRPICNIPSGFR